MTMWPCPRSNPTLGAKPNPISKPAATALWTRASQVAVVRKTREACTMIGYSPPTGTPQVWLFSAPGSVPPGLPTHA